MLLIALVENSIFSRLYMRRGIIWNDSKSSQGFKDSQTQWGRLLLFSWKYQVSETLLQLLQRKFLARFVKMQHCKISKKILSTYLLKYFLFPFHVALCQPLVCVESQGLSAQEVLESGSFLLLLLGKVCKIVRVEIKAWLYSIRLNSSWTSSLVLIFSLLLARKITSSSDVLCFNLAQRRCKMIWWKVIYCCVH